MTQPRAKNRKTTGGWKEPTTVAEHNTVNTMLALSLRENLSPHAVAAIVSCLRINRTNNNDVDTQVHWFAEELCKLLGGYAQQSRLAEELGL